MAPKKKQKQVASFYGTFYSSRFWNEEASNFHASFIRKSMAHERGFDLSHPKDGSGMSSLKPLYVVKSLVREFYVNLKVIHENLQVLVRGKMVTFDNHAINTMYELPDIDEDDYSEYMAEHLDYNEIIGELCCERASWRTTNDAPIKFSTADMFQDAKNRFLFLAARMMPSSHTFDVTKDRVALVYSIVMKKSIDVGKIIQDSILHAVLGATTGGLPHSSLITDICQYAGVTWDRDDELLRPLAPLVVCQGTCGISMREHEQRKLRRGASSSRSQPTLAAPTPAPRMQSEQLDLLERQMEAQNHWTNAFMDYMVDFTIVLAHRLPGIGPDDAPFPPPPTWPPQDEQSNDDH